MSSYGGYNAYPPTAGMYGNQQLLTNYPASNYYNTGMMGGYGAGGYYPNTTGYMGYGGYGGGYGGGMYGGGMYGGYGSGYGGYLPYKQSTLRTIYNRLRHGTSYPYYGSGGSSYPYEYGRHRGSWIDYQ